MIEGQARAGVLEAPFVIVAGITRASKSQPQWLYKGNHCISFIHRLPSWILTGTSNVPPTPHHKMTLNPTSASFKPH
jgi:hypothetical protein